MIERIEKTLKESGFATFDCSDESTTEELVASIGVLDTFPGISPIQCIEPATKDQCEKSSYSGNYGLEEFPLHSDMAHWWAPPRFLLLRCMVPPEEEVVTSVVRSDDVMRGEDPLDLRREVFCPRRRLRGRRNLLHLLDGEIFRWDSLFLTPIRRSGAELQDRITNTIKAMKAKEISLNHAGACLLLDNWRTLHGRSKVSDGSRDRRIERAYISKIGIDNAAHKS